MKASNTSNKRTVSRYSQSTVSRYSEPYWRIPKSVGECKELSAYSRCVYGLMASKVRQGNIAVIGYTEIVRRLGFAKSTVVQSIQQLIDGGHVVSLKQGKRKPTTYELTSPVFGQKQRDDITEVVSSPRGQRRMVTIGQDRIRA